MEGWGRGVGGERNAFFIFSASRSYSSSTSCSSGDSSSFVTVGSDSVGSEGSIFGQI